MECTEIGLGPSNGQIWRMAAAKCWEQRENIDQLCRRGKPYWGKFLQSGQSWGRIRSEWFNPLGWRFGNPEGHFT
ncbi:MAG: hypothetical protein Hyperionvirus5_51 [Hyperionvirus sp.]|uniref:Uncharacterized protein n=1 Tax=Hyperionvirus sp. TaxID=2487770 RepID=A0A3G5A7N8_9VIRU|nr:MAG: hypothetical protein Hyperionvirus5_51 [Hyperionvirus sp.]